MKQWGMFAYYSNNEICQAGRMLQAGIRVTSIITAVYKDLTISCVACS
jgi:hypothetical protein